MRDFRLAMAPMVSDPEDIDANAHRISDLAEQASNCGCKVICFPEASLTGYSSTNPQAVSAKDLRIAEIADMSEDIDIIFGFVEETDEGLYVSQAVCVDGDVVGMYRKTHLGVKQKKAFKPGKDLPVFETDNAKIGMSLCWESHFPEITGTYERKGAELVLMPSASNLDYERRMSTWDSIMYTRATDNRVFVAACNCDGRAVICFAPNGMAVEGEQMDGFTVYDLDSDLYKKYRGAHETIHHVRYQAYRRPELYR